jgi:hypothetical protein
MRIAELQPATVVAHGLPGGEAAASAWLARLLAIYTDTHRRTGEHKEATLQVWRRVSKELLRPPPEHPFQLHQLLFDAVYSEWNVSTLGPRPTWIPTAAEAANTNLARFMRVYVGDEQWRRQRTQQPLRDWPALHAASVRDPESFWAAVFRHEFRLDFAVPPTCMVDRAANLGAGAWLPGAFTTHSRLKFSSKANLGHLVGSTKIGSCSVSRVGVSILFASRGLATLRCSPPDSLPRAVQGRASTWQRRRSRATRMPPPLSPHWKHLPVS